MPNTPDNYKPTSARIRGRSRASQTSQHLSSDRSASLPWEQRVFGVRWSSAGGVWSDASGLLAVQNFVLHKKIAQQESLSYLVLIDNTVQFASLSFVSPSGVLMELETKKKGLIFHHSRKKCASILVLYENKKKIKSGKIAQNIKINHCGEKKKQSLDYVLYKFSFIIISFCQRVPRLSAFISPPCICAALTVNHLTAMRRNEILQWDVIPRKTCCITVCHSPNYRRRRVSSLLPSLFVEKEGNSKVSLTR